MKAKISPGKRKYEKMQAIASKSYVHRYLIAAALAGEVTTLYTDILSEDMLATMDCLNAIGASAMRIKGGIRIVPMRKDSELCKPTLKCRESGSTARFMLPVMSALFPAFCMEGEGRLPNRPFAPICKALKENGVETSGNYLPMYVQGRLKAGTFSISGNVSSQYITGLLFALPLLEDDSKIMLTSKLESKGYIDITISVLKEFGIQVEETEYGYFVPGNQTYCSPGIIHAPGDWSNAAFFLCMGALGEGVMLTGLNQEDLQGDRAVVDILKKFGADVHVTEEGIEVLPGPLQGIVLDVSQIPDLVPVLCVVAAHATGDTEFHKAERLRIKESDRIVSMQELLKNLGCEMIDREEADGHTTLIVKGRESSASGFLHGGCVDGYKDHRIVMSAATAAVGSGCEITIIGVEAVDKSYPGFFEDYRRIFEQVDIAFEM